MRNLSAPSTKRRPNGSRSIVKGWIAHALAATHQTLLRDFLRAKYADKKVDAVVAVFGPALDFLLDHGAEIFPGAAIVFCGIDQAELGDRTLPPHARGVLLKREFSPTLELALSLHPQTRQVVIVGGYVRLLMRCCSSRRKKNSSLMHAASTSPTLTALPLQKLFVGPQTASAEQLSSWLRASSRTARVNPSFRTMWFRSSRWQRAYRSTAFSISSLVAASSAANCTAQRHRARARRSWFCVRFRMPRRKARKFSSRPSTNFSSTGGNSSAGASAESRLAGGP